MYSKNENEPNYADLRAHLLVLRKNIHKLN